MSTIKVKLEDWKNYLEERVNIDLYVWGANDELLVNLLNKLVDMETSEKNVDRILTLLQKRLLQGVDILKIRCDDCSGLAVGFLLKHGIIKSDTTADGLYNMISKKVSLKDVKAGDYLFQGSDSKKTHVGYAISDKYAIEAKGRDDGVVKTRISDRGWGYAKRPDWYEDIEPEKYILHRELKLENSMMRGEDVERVQERLNELGYNCGDPDGVFGKKTEIAAKNFKHDAGLKSDSGTIGKKTAEKLGFGWEA